MEVSAFWKPPEQAAKAVPKAAGRSVWCCIEHFVNTRIHVKYIAHGTLHTETHASPNDSICGNCIPCFKQEAACLRTGHKRWHPDGQTDSACVRERSVQFNEDCLDFPWVCAYYPVSWRSNLEGISKTIVRVLAC